jgi:ankyrin repeat protein
MVRALVTQGCDINVRLKNGHTPLSFAVHYQNLEVIKALLDLGADPTQSRAGRDNCTPLDDAILNMSHGGDTVVVDILLASDKCLINCGKDPLHTAFSHVLMKAATLPQDTWLALAVKMVESVKDVNNDKCAVGCGLLHVATLRGNVEMVDLLLSKGADIEAADELGVTPLIMACQHSPKLIPILIEKGANINALYKYESDVMAGAASYGNVESLKILMETYKRDIDVKTGRGHTPLACALTWGEEKAALYLIEKGADVHWKTQDKKQTALHFATTEGLVRVVEELLKQNVDVNARDIVGWTPLHQVCKVLIITLLSLVLPLLMFIGMRTWRRRIGPNAPKRRRRYRSRPLQR